MTAATAPAPADSSTSAGPDVHHLTCCQPCCPPDLAICGIDVTGVPETSGAGETPCPLCYQARRDAIPCPAAGCSWRKAAV